MAAPRPVVKWAGGKTRLLDRLMERLPKGRFATYAEPFCGGAAMFFALAAEPKRRFDRALLTDKNEELVALYRAIKADVEALIDKLGAYRDHHLARDLEGRREHFYEVRKKDTAKMTTVDRGARLLFLNKTCFNGLWRVNASGQFNVPFGKYDNPRILDEQGLRSASVALADATIRCANYAEATNKLTVGDFAYFDPPYMPVSRTSNFTAYAADRFGWDEQAKLAADIERLDKRGVKAMLSNASTAELRALYEKSGFVVGTIRAARAINSDPTKRGDVEELVATTYRSVTSRPAAGVRATRRRAAV